MRKPKLFDAIYWKRKAKKFEIKYLAELDSNDPLKQKVIYLQSELNNQLLKRDCVNEDLDSLKKRIEVLEKKVKTNKR